MLTVACVLKSGGIYSAEWVGKLQRGVRRNLTCAHRFVCLSDIDVPCERIALEADWPGWWSKIELFRPDLLTGPTLYFDLDTLVVGSLDEIAAYPHRFTMVHEFYRPELLCSTAMAWSGDHAHIWHAMLDMTQERRDAYDKSCAGRIGDQAFIEDCMAGQHVDRFRDLFGERSIASYKAHCRNYLRGDEAVVAFHGLPKPCDVRGGWVATLWEET